VGSSFRLGRVAGVEVGVNWSWLVVFALITWSLAAGVFPDQDPGRSQATYVAMAVIAAVLFFGSLLAHELGHAVTARREGMELDGITLWLFGGVARFKGRFPSAGAELRIALAGPAVSLGIGVACSLLAWAIALPGGVDGVLAWIGYVNLVLLGFVGWFLLGAATAEQRYLAARQALAGLRVGDLMTPDPITVPSDHTLGEFIDDVAWQRRHTTYPVIDGGHFAGLLVFQCVSSVPRDQWDARSVRSCMIPAEEVPRLRQD
jgi:hypothetical protein